ncbi:hypothetical protein AB4Y89_21670 [Terriglobus sp. 2YAB30_2]|uniref:hypothetical protein n=1 Tax=Terriglobus sp. 2YAB30_2 TaxID=3233023 RepID=UPI003F9493A8
MRKLFALCALLGAFCAAHGQINLTGHSVVPSTTDSDHGLSSVVIGDANCNVTSPSGCTVPSGTGPYRGTFMVTSSVSLTADRCLILPLSPGRAVYVKNSTTGGKQVCVKGSTGGAATFANGQSGVAFSDGTNYNVISANGSSTAALGLVIADGVTYTTIQAAYTAACGAVPNLNVYVPASSTVTDGVYSTPNYMISTCTSQVTDDRSGSTYSSRGSNVFLAQTPRRDYFPREGTLKSHWIDLLNNGVTPANTGIPSIVQWPVAFHGDSVSGFATFYTLMQSSFGLGVAGFYSSAAHVGTGNNEGFYGLGQGSINLTSLTSGTVTNSPNGSADPTTVNGSSTILGSSSTTGTLTFYLVASQQGTETRFRNMQQASIFYLCDGKPATINVQSSPDGINFFNETIGSAQPNACAATGGVVAVGVQGVGSGQGCNTLTLGATGGTGFVGTAEPNSSGAIDHVLVNSAGSGYNPYTSTITVTSGSCTTLPSWGNILTSNISIQQAVISHDGIGIVKITNSGDAVKLLGWGLYNPNQSGMVFEDMGFGGSSYDSLFAAPDSYTTPWYNGMPVPDTIYTQYLDNRNEAGNPLETWFQKDYDRTVAQHAAKAATFGTLSACNAAGYGWDTLCNPYTPDLVWVSGYPGGNTAIVGTGTGAGGDLAVMNQVTKINRAGGNAIYVDDTNSQPNGQDSFRRVMFGQADTTHQTPGGRALQNSITQQIGGIPQQDLYASKAFTAVHVGQGSVTTPSVSFIRTGGEGFIYNSGYRQIMALGGLVGEGSITITPGTYANPSTYIPVTGSASATYMICAAGATNLQPIGCTPAVSITTGPTTLSSTNYVQVCLARPILGAAYYALIRTAGYSGPIVVYNTVLYTNANTPPCMNDTGQAGSTYTASQWNPSGYLRINSPNAPVDFGGWASVRTADSLYDLQFGEGTNAGQIGGFGIAMRTVANVNNFCRFSLGVSTSWAGALGCAGTYTNAPFNFLNPIYINPGSTTAPNIDIATATGFMTGTVPMFRIRANSSAGACPSGGCGLFVSSDGAFAGYLALFDFNGARKFGIKPSGLEFFGNTLYPITAVPGTGVNLLRSIGNLNNGNLAAFDASNNAVDSGVATSSLYSLGGTVNVDSCTLGSAAGSGTSCTAVGVDAAHIVTVTMGSGATTTGNLVTITLATNRPRPTLAVCSHSPSTVAAATDYSKSIIVGNAANQYTIAFPASAPTASVTYTWSVTCP